MRVLVLPGGTSPYSGEKYRTSYEDIVRALALAAPGARVELVLYPGQVDERGAGLGELTIGRAAERVLEVLHGGGADDVRVLGVCFGSIVGANVLLRAGVSLSRACFYGPLPYWKFASAEFLEGPTWTDASRGVIATGTIVRGGAPFEEAISSPPAVPLKVAVGSKDRIVAPATLDYYRALAPRRASVAFALIPGAPHIVSAASRGWDAFSRECLDWVVAPEGDGAGLAGP
jgi:hypothetical protein